MWAYKEMVQSNLEGKWFDKHLSTYPLLIGSFLTFFCFLALFLVQRWSILLSSAVRGLHNPVSPSGDPAAVVRNQSPSSTCDNNAEKFCVVCTSAPWIIVKTSDKIQVVLETSYLSLETVLNPGKKQDVKSACCIPAFRKKNGHASFECDFLTTGFSSSAAFFELLVGTW